MHRYTKKQKFVGEFIVFGEGDWDNLDDRTFERLEKAEDYIIGFFEDDVSIEKKSEIIEEYEEYRKEETEPETFKDWLMNREIMFLVVKD